MLDRILANRSAKEDPGRAVAARRSRLLVALLALGAAGACAAPPADDVQLSTFAEGEPILGRVIENVTACEVDAVCYLDLEFADRTAIAYYGTGERPAPACPISKEVSDASFPVPAGAIIEVVVRDCPGEGFFLERVSAAGAGADGG